MFGLSLLPLLSGVLSLASAASATCTGSLGAGTAAASDPYWLETVTHQGIVPENSDSGYQVFRNVKDFGAKGDGVTDDTVAINSAISSGNRCAGQPLCPSSTTSPALIYFPAGTYLVSKAINAYYYSHLIGDAKNPPTLLAAPSFAGEAVIDADPVGGSGASWYNDTNNFFRSVRNFVIDLRQQPASTGTGIHWQLSQSTSLMNIVVEMSTDPSTNQQGMFMENGSGGYMGDIVFNGGKYGAWLGNQQFTVRNLTVNNAQTGIWMQWNWGWTFQGVTFNNCGVGFDLLTGGLTQDTQTVGGEAIIDAVATNTPIFVRSSTNSQGSLHGSLVLNNIKLNNVPTAVAVTDGTVVLQGSSSTTTIDSWVQGNVYTGSSKTGKFTQGTVTATKPASLLDSAGRIFGRTHPQYPTFAASQLVSVRANGAKGDGKTDDTKAIQAIFDGITCDQLVYFDHGTYIVTDTITIPANTRIVGEVWPVVMGSGSAFSDQANPKQVIKAGNDGDVGTIEITDMIFGTQAGSGGAIVLEWNIHGDAQGSAGMWDTHLRIGGAVGTGLQTAQCPFGSDNTDTCMAAFLALHITAKATAYFEGTWVWLADHDLDDVGQTQLTLFSGRGLLSESAGPVWLIGTGVEHHTLYQYALIGASDHYMGLIQTETPYYQPSPSAPTPFSVNSAYHDPASTQSSAWGVWVEDSTDIFVFGAGLYSFFENFSQDCLPAGCQSQILNIDDTSTISIFGLATVGVVNQLSIDQSPIIASSDNPDGFQGTVTAWTRS